MTFATPSSADAARNSTRIIIKPLNVAPVGPAAKASSRKQAKAAGSDRPALIMLGRDDTGKPHASWFGGADTASATAAASLMGMVVIPVDTPQLEALAAKLPQGRVFASGKAFVPFVKGALFEQISNHVPDEQRKALERRGGAKRLAAADSTARPRQAAARKLQAIPCLKTGRRSPSTAWCWPIPPTTRAGSRRRS